MRYIACCLMFVLPAMVVAQDALESHPITFKADDVHVIAEFSASSNGLKITGTDIAVIPIRCDAGITGAIIIGNGDYSYATAEGGQTQAGKFRAAMLRFNPKDQPELFAVSPENAITDHAFHEMGRHMLDNVFRHCWHSGMEALLPDPGSFVANVYSTTQGDLLISTGPTANVVHSFTENKTLASNP